MTRPLRPLVVSALPATEQIAAVAAVLDRRDGCLLPVAEGVDGERVMAAAHCEDPLSGDLADAVLAVATTGSTGTPKIVLHARRSLLASVAATADRLGGHGQWLLCLGINHIAGIQVVLRSVAAGISPVVCPAGGDEFTGDFAAAAARLDGPRRYVSLVPAQLQRLLDSPQSPVLSAFDAILLGGAAADPALLERAAAAGARVVTTYGSSETGGGCVYDGVALGGVSVDIRDDGIVRLGGDVVALGYRDRVDRDPFEDPGWFTTSDLGEMVGGRLRISGRADDVINTGGKKVSPARVEQALRALAPVADVIVVGVPDPSWGQRVTAVVQLAPAGTAGPDSGDLLPELQDALRGALAPHELPRGLLVVDELPYKGIGKPDRAGALNLAISG